MVACVKIDYKCWLCVHYVTILFALWFIKLVNKNIWLMTTIHCIYVGL